ncbi:MAG: hypothetical protein ACE5E4_05930 [Candidatus Binatia bacterium]
MSASVLSRLVLAAALLSLPAAGCAPAAWYWGSTPLGQAMIPAGEEAISLSSEAITVEEFEVEYWKRDPFDAALVGEAMVSVRHDRTRGRIDQAMALRDFDVGCLVNSKLFEPMEPGACRRRPLSELRGRKGDEFRINARVWEQGEYWYIVQLDARDGVFFLVVDENGYLRPYRNVAWRWLRLGEFRHGEQRPSPTSSRDLVWHRPLSPQYVDDPDSHRHAPPFRGERLTYMELPESFTAEGPLFALDRTRVEHFGYGRRNFDLVYGGLIDRWDGPHFRVIYEERSPGMLDYVVYRKALDFPVGTEQLSINGVDLLIRTLDEELVIFSASTRLQLG